MSFCVARRLRRPLATAEARQRNSVIGCRFLHHLALRPDVLQIFSPVIHSFLPMAAPAASSGWRNRRSSSRGLASLKQTEKRWWRRGHTFRAGSDCSSQRPVVAGGSSPTTVSLSQSAEGESRGEPTPRTSASRINSTTRRLKGAEAPLASRSWARPTKTTSAASAASSRAAT